MWGTLEQLNNGNINIVGYPLIHFSAMLRYVPWAIWLGISFNYESLMRQFYWFHMETTAETSQWNYVLYLSFGLPFKTCAYSWKHNILPRIECNRRNYCGCRRCNINQLRFHNRSVDRERCSYEESCSHWRLKLCLSDLQTSF